MDVFSTEDFLLTNKAAMDLYHEFAENLPIVDYHCHIPPREIAENRRFTNMTQIWLAGDHYKWRAMRAAGVPEDRITGGASDWEKFLAWAETVPKTIGNPLYHWTHLELKRPFGISDVLLNGTTAQMVWERCNACLAEKEFSAQGIIRQMNVELLCTTDDPIDSLEFHQQLKRDTTCPFRVLPAFRADKALDIDQGPAFLAYVEKLGVASGIAIGSYQNLLHALKKRHDYFHEQGCRLSDHGLETVYVEDCAESELESIFRRALSGKTIDPLSARKYKSALLFELCLLDYSKEWVQQFHLGVLRNVNPRRLRELGLDTGFDTIGSFDIAQPLSAFLGKLDDRGLLAKTIIYNSNPADNEMMAAMIGNFQDGRIPGKIQYGGPWWFMDQKDGIERHLNALSNMGLLSQFIGMPTDSRSLLSYPRHDYFRRVLCNLLGAEIEKGLIPHDMDLVGGLVTDVCYRNIRRYLDLANEDPMSSPRLASLTSTVV